ncbi:hypothetical protein CS063_03570 [Sporanaerobium hydrogeniformans]|uniref:Uncharacterized protein n=1 Tax=Sporanaerobium hydrogeniformans TaxID=3072179 RepID=A0AC61DEN3_9FIRM|nr:stage V sporulation protein AA [Sporanaerobium hydrogeniformans]PHV71655.1 hypothetical protein CS063_03570 [Sporanaerobium hydrogeniformans]
MSNEIAYIRLYRKVTLEAKKQVYMKDISEIYAAPQLRVVLENLSVFNIPKVDKKGHYVLSIIQIIAVITAKYPQIILQSVGEMDTMIDYSPKVTEQKPLLEWLKVSVVSLIVFVGATVAIMTYNTDTSLPETFIILNRMFTGEEVKNPIYITVPYSFGIACGVIVFFNHIGRKKLSDDPSPMQVEMNQYEKQVEESVIDSLTDKKRGEP